MSASSPAPDSPIPGPPPPSSDPPGQPPPPPDSSSGSPPRGAPPPPESSAPPTADTPPPQSPPHENPPPPTLPPPPPSEDSPPPEPPPAESPPPPVVTTPSPPPSIPPLPLSPPPPVSPVNSPPPPVPSDPPETSPPPPPENPSPPPPLPPRNAPPPPRTPNRSPPPPLNSPSPNPPPPPSELPPQESPPPPPPRRPGRSPPPPPTPSPPPNPLPPFLNPPPGSPPPSIPSTPSPPNFSPPPESTHSPDGGGISTAGTVAISSIFGFLLLLTIGVAACCIWKRKRKNPGQNGNHILPTSDSGLSKIQLSATRTSISRSTSESGGLGASKSWFTFDELFEATNGFAPQNLLGEGGFGSVYKGRLASGQDVAVKQLKIGGGQGEREFRSEVEIISRIHHRHLVSLIGHCILDNKRLLVYDYVVNNTLYYHLHGKGRQVMNWATRVKVAIGAARGLAYLHEDCHPRIIHRDIKSSNILLDNNFEAKVSDFGLAKIAMDANTHITTRVMGTFGYMAPEYATSGKLTEKSDVYSFGVVLLELITGRKPVDRAQPVGEESLVEWARPLLSQAIETNEFSALVDPVLEQSYLDNEMFRMIEAAAVCIRHSAKKRPKMIQVLRAFDNMVTSDLSNGMKLGDSQIYNSAQQSEEIRLFQRMAFGSQNFSTDFFSQNSWSSEGNQANNNTSKD